MKDEILIKQAFKFDPNSTKNEGRLRIVSPKEFKPNSYWRKKDKDEPGISFVMGEKKDGTTTVQAIRFDLSKWDENSAGAWWKKNRSKYNKTWKDSDWKKENKSKRKKAIEYIEQIIKVAEPLPIRHNLDYADDKPKAIVLPTEKEAEEVVVEIAKQLGYVSVWEGVQGISKTNQEHQVVRFAGEIVPDNVRGALYMNVYPHSSRVAQGFYGLYGWPDVKAAEEAKDLVETIVKERFPFTEAKVFKADDNSWIALIMVLFRGKTDESDYKAKKANRSNRLIKLSQVEQRLAGRDEVRRVLAEIVRELGLSMNFDTYFNYIRAQIRPPKTTEFPDYESSREAFHFINERIDEYTSEETEWETRWPGLATEIAGVEIGGKTIGFVINVEVPVRFEQDEPPIDKPIEPEDFSTRIANRANSLVKLGQQIPTTPQVIAFFRSIEAEYDLEMRVYWGDGERRGDIIIFKPSASSSYSSSWPDRESADETANIINDDLAVQGWSFFMTAESVPADTTWGRRPSDYLVRVELPVLLDTEPELPPANKPIENRIANRQAQLIKLAQHLPGDREVVSVMNSIVSDLGADISSTWNWIEDENGIIIGISFVIRKLSQRKKPFQFYRPSWQSEKGAQEALQLIKADIVAQGWPDVSMRVEKVSGQTPVYPPEYLIIIDMPIEITETHPPADKPIEPEIYPERIASRIDRLIKLGQQIPTGKQVVSFVRTTANELNLYIVYEYPYYFDNGELHSIAFKIEPKKHSYWKNADDANKVLDLIKNDIKAQGWGDFVDARVIKNHFGYSIHLGFDADDDVILPPADKLNEPPNRIAHRQNRLKKLGQQSLPAVAQVVSLMNSIADEYNLDMSWFWAAMEENGTMHIFRPKTSTSWPDHQSANETADLIYADIEAQGWSQEMEMYIEPDQSTGNGFWIRVVFPILEPNDPEYYYHNPPIVDKPIEPQPSLEPPKSIDYANDKINETKLPTENEAKIEIMSKSALLGYKCMPFDFIRLVPSSYLGKPTPDNVIGFVSTYIFHPKLEFGGSLRFSWPNKEEAEEAGDLIRALLLESFDLFAVFVIKNPYGGSNWVVEIEVPVGNSNAYINKASDKLELPTKDKAKQVANRLIKLLDLDAYLDWDEYNPFEGTLFASLFPATFQPGEIELDEGWTDKAGAQETADLLRIELERELGVNPYVEIRELENKNKRYILALTIPVKEEVFFKNDAKDKVFDKEDHDWDEVLIDKDGITKTRGQIRDYYLRNLDKIFPYVKDKDVIVILGTGKNKNVLKRNIDGGERIHIKSARGIDDQNSLEYWIWRRMIEIHIVSNSTTDMVWIDWDPHSNSMKAAAKRAAIEGAKVIKDIFPKAKTIVYDSGKRGFHTMGFLGAKVDVDNAREKLKQALKEKYEDSTEITTGLAKENQIRADITTLHKDGSIRAPFSFTIDGKAKVPLSLSNSADDIEPLYEKKKQPKSFLKAIHYLDPILKELGLHFSAGNYYIKKDITYYVGLIRPKTMDWGYKWDKGSADEAVELLNAFFKKNDVIGKAFNYEIDKNEYQVKIEIAICKCDEFSKLPCDFCMQKENKADDIELSYKKTLEEGENKVRHMIDEARQIRGINEPLIPLNDYQKQIANSFIGQTVHHISGKPTVLKWIAWENGRGIYLILSNGEVVKNTLSLNPKPKKVNKNDANDDFSAISFMRLKKIDDPNKLLKKYDIKNLIVEPKIDGFKIMALRNNEVKLYTRRGEDVSQNVPELVEELYTQLPPKTAILGEITVLTDGQDISSVQTLLGSNPENVPEIKGKIIYYVYDILSYKSENITQKPLKERREILNNIIKPTKYIQLVKSYSFEKWPEVMKMALDENGEGVVFKDVNSVYKYKLKGENEPVGDWYKFKPSQKAQTTDVVLKEYEKGEHKLLFPMYQRKGNEWVSIGIISGMSKEEENQIKDAIDSGQMLAAEISFQDWTKEDRIRHAGWVRLRPDRDPNKIMFRN